jgi:uncharacterized DUF497 family protein
MKRLDDRRDDRETRFIALGTYAGEVLYVVFTERDGDIRLIPAREGSKHERGKYQGC